MNSATQINTPDIWLPRFPQPKPDGHKYDRGHALVLAAPELTGATRLATTACSRIGAGLTTVLAPVRADIYRTVMPADVMVRENAADISSKIAVTLGGPGGMLVEHRDAMLDNRFKSKRVFDAAAIPHNADFSFLDQNCVLTPHAREFEKTFADLSGSPKSKAATAAKECGAIVVLKGTQTVIADPSGRLVVNSHASPYLAKAGTGDVLGGMITGLMAQGMPNFEACCAAVWLHGDAALRFGAGLIASDIPDILPKILQDLLANQ